MEGAARERGAADTGARGGGGGEGRRCNSGLIGVSATLAAPAQLAVLHLRLGKGCRAVFHQSSFSDTSGLRCLATCGFENVSRRAQ